MSLTKNTMTNENEFVDFSETLVSTCDNNEQFDDGTDKEKIKCTTADERVGIWSHKEYTCNGNRHYNSLHLSLRSLIHLHYT